jgi:hypothetical protein
MGYVRSRGGLVLTRSKNPFQFWAGVVALFLGAAFLIVFGLIVIFGKVKL